jgi:Na+-translocating ferredoxin:NAD+ oxidoreductase RnfG subunit
MKLDKVLGIILAVLAAIAGVILSQQKDITTNTVDIRHNKAAISEIKKAD